MSFSRLALRLAALEALCPSASAAAGPYPTWAGSNVFDSRITPISDVGEWENFIGQIEGRPVVTVYTEEHETDPTAGEYPADREIVDLVIEIMIIAEATIELENPDGTLTIIADVTSAQHEATLDMLEAQIRDLLDPNSGLCPLPYFKVARELHHVKSVPIRDVQGQSRRAARTMSMKLRVAHQRRSTEVGLPSDIAGLPEPLLTVAKALEPLSAGGQLVRQIAKGQAPAPILAPLRDVRIYTSVDRGAVPTAQTADLVSDQTI